MQRPEVDARVVLAEAELNVEEGLAGQLESALVTHRGRRAASDMQLNIMNARIPPISPVHRSA